MIPSSHFPRACPHAIAGNHASKPPPHHISASASVHIPPLQTYTNDSPPVARPIPATLPFYLTQISTQLHPTLHSKMSTTTPQSSTPDNIPSEPVIRSTEKIHVELTPHELDSLSATRFVRDPSAGATVLFIGTTRDSFNGVPVEGLAYTAYVPLGK